MIVQLLYKNFESFQAVTISALHVSFIQYILHQSLIVLQA